MSSLSIHNHIPRVIALGIASLIANSAFAAQSNEVSLLPVGERNKIQFSSQPNLDKGEVSMPKQDAIIFVINQPVDEFIKQVSRLQNLKLTMTQSVSGQLQKISLPMKLEGMMKVLSSSYGLEWHLRGNHLFVSNSLENTNRLIDLGSMNLVTLKRAMEAAQIKAGANVITYKQEDNKILVIGSKEFISKVEGVVKTFRSQKQSSDTQLQNTESASN